MKLPNFFRSKSNSEPTTQESASQSAHSSDVLASMANQFDPAAAQRARESAAANSNASSHISETGNREHVFTRAGESEAERLLRQQENIKNANILGDDAKERAFIDNIAGNWNTTNGSSEKIADALLDSPRERKILAYMVASDMSLYDVMGVDSVSAFIHKNPNPIDFDAKAEAFLDRLAEANGANGSATRARYEEAMASFRNKIYGKKEQYWNAIKSLKDREPAEPTPRNPERLNEWPIGSSGSSQLSRSQVKAGLANRTDLWENNTKVSDECEDSLMMRPDRKFYGVFDGVGGSTNGRAASSLAEKVISDLSDHYHLKSGNDLAWALNQASSAINQNVADGYSTGTLAKITELDSGKRQLSWASIGDSRLYIVKQSGETTQITTDEGEGHRLTKGLGAGGDAGAATQFGDLILTSGDRIVLCSDGITGDYGDDLMSAAELGNIVQHSDSAENAAKNLLINARKNDDRTAIVVQGA